VTDSRHESTYETKKVEQMSDVDRSIAEAPLPTAGTLRRRKSLFYQATRFVAFNLRMMKMVTRAHH
jgi:hypothetical protein